MPRTSFSLYALLMIIAAATSMTLIGEALIWTDKLGATGDLANTFLGVMWFVIPTMCFKKICDARRAHPAVQ
ncbi:MAG: hypothetical protein V4465_02240 [Patescibacteria group bacterium]